MNPYVQVMSQESAFYPGYFDYGDFLQPTGNWGWPIPAPLHCQQTYTIESQRPTFFTLAFYIHGDVQISIHQALGDPSPMVFRPDSHNDYKFMTIKDIPIMPGFPLTIETLSLGKEALALVAGICQ